MRPRTVLLVDDDEEIRQSTAQSLELAGFAVREFASAEAVLDYITPGLRGIVISDIRMPGMDGMTLLGRVRDVDSEVPVILVTGHGDGGHGSSGRMRRGGEEVPAAEESGHGSEGDRDRDRTRDRERTRTHAGVPLGWRVARGASPAPRRPPA